MKGNLVTGAGYFFRGLSMLPEKGIRSFVILPLAANIILFGVLGSLAYDYVQSLITSTEEALPDWLGFLTWLLIPFALAGGRTPDRLRINAACTLVYLALSFIARRKSRGTSDG